MQAIVGLLVFKEDPDVTRFLQTILHHPNDMIKDMVCGEFFKGVVANKSLQTSHPKHLRDMVLQGDVSDILDTIPDEAIHMTFTSPPYYNARDYSIYSTYKEYLDFLEMVFKKVHRVTKEGRFFILNTSPVIVPRAGRKYSSRRYAVPFDIHPRLTEMGWDFVDEIVWEKPEASVKNRVSGFNVHRKPLTYKPNTCTEYVMVYRKKSHRLIDWNLKQYDPSTVADSLINDDFDRTNIWKIPPVSSKKHSAVFPIELPRRVIKLYSFVHDLIFDPFAGSGTTAVAAVELNRHYLMTEICEDYVNVMKQRISSTGSRLAYRGEVPSNR